jgi:hypothetical protein
MPVGATPTVARAKQIVAAMRKTLLMPMMTLLFGEEAREMVEGLALAIRHRSRTLG